MMLAMRLPPFISLFIFANVWYIDEMYAESQIFKQSAKVWFKMQRTVS